MWQQMINQPRPQLAPAVTSMKLLMTPHTAQTSGAAIKDHYREARADEGDHVDGRRVLRRNGQQPNKLI
ncbi:unnamed protein product [Photorhabdus laumondii subsp. laumondii TTO1]|uniref:Photorhabdus luminescens subsp. laumondii TTO1 complete genome segment 15/17 n=1 Tax=Photorhabdus laumondii subsp. laumondii (strain DSM 15139 / CIP 105565 / TT01) TaxID=243265 RepID=Q7MZ65_PHOLL|nr:unnamed protein product [Photorhabdus laumondii subsp. laumondii TTO1]